MSAFFLSKDVANAMYDHRKTSVNLTVLTCALHTQPKGYIGGGWTRTVELLKRATAHNVKFVLIETQPAFKSVYELDYEAIEIPSFLNKSFIGRIIRCFMAVMYGVLRVKNGDINLVLSPVEIPECVLPACLISKITKLPWTSEIHLIPGYASFWKNEEPSEKTSSFRDLLHEHRRHAEGTFFLIFVSLAQWLVFRAFRRGVMLAPSKSVVEDMQYVDRDVAVKYFHPGNGIAIERINNVKSETKRYDAIYVGVLGEKKGVFDAIRIWRLVVKKKPRLVLAIVGRGSEKDVNKVKSMVRHLNIENNVIFPFDLRTGAPTLEDVWFSMKQSKMLMHLSVSDTWPQVIGEALACGIPVVTYDLRPQKYAFGECPVMFTVPVKDLEACSSKILEMVENYSESYAKIAREFSKRFTWDAVMTAEKKAFLAVIDRYKSKS